MRRHGSHRTALLLFLCGMLFCLLFRYVANAQEETTAQQRLEIRKQQRFESTFAKAKSGDVKEQLELSHMFRDGDGVDESESEADYWLLKSAEKGNPEAQVELGWSHFDRKEYEKAFPWFLKAAQAGDVKGQEWVANCYFQGLGTGVDYDQTMQWSLKAASQGGDNSIIAIGYLYEHGQGVTVDYEKALQWYKLAAEKGIALGQVNLASLYLRGLGVPQDYRAAEHWYSLAARQGAPEAQMGLVAVYIEGPPGLKNLNKAIPLLEAAAETNTPGARITLARFCLTGEIPKLKKDPVRAMQLLKTAAEEGDTDAQVLMGAAEEEMKNFREAELWYQKAAKQGDVAAMFGLAELYNRGEGVPRNFEKAGKLYIQANDSEEITAVVANNAGWFFATCEDPKYRNPDLAIKYGLKAVEMSESKNAGFLDTLAEAYFTNAQYALAVSTEQRALELEPENKDFRKSLERFRSALEASKAKAQDSSPK